MRYLETVEGADGVTEFVIHNQQQFNEHPCEEPKKKL